MDPRRPSLALIRFILAAFVLIQLGLALAPGLHGKTLTILHGPGGAQVHFADRHHLGRDHHQSPEHHHQHSLDCPLCLAAFAPLPETGASLIPPRPMLLSWAFRRDETLCSRIEAARPARGPPSGLI